jgi:hypothetical protein
VADGRDDGHARGADGARHLLLIERPEVFGRAAAAADDDGVEPFFGAAAFDGAPVVVVQTPDGLGDLAGGALALHAHGREEQADGARAARDGADDVADGRARRARDDADAARKQRQLPLARLVKQPLGGQPLAQLLEGHAQRARADGVERLDQKLVLAARLVDGEAAARAHEQAVRGPEADAPVDAAEALGAQLRRLVLDREVPVARLRRAEVRNLALDPHGREPPFERAPHLRRQLRNRQRPALRLVEQRHEQGSGHRGLA